MLWSKCPQTETAWPKCPVTETAQTETPQTETAQTKKSCSGNVYGNMVEKNIMYQPQQKINL